MCGHVGIAGKLAFKDEATMKRLLLLDYFRGPDSTGFAAVRGNGDTRVAKVPSHPLDLYDMGKFKEALNGNQSTVFLGHNRLSTRGVINHHNTHPFQYDHIIGAHNGTLEYSSTSALEKALDEKFPVDSQAIIAGIARLGVENTIPMLQGAWSLVWIDSKEGTLNFLRNKERSMWYGYDKDFERLFWASEWSFINSAVQMAPTGQYEMFTDEQGHRFWSTEENIHYRFDIDELKSGKKERPKPKAKELRGKEPAPAVVTGTSGGYNPFGRRGENSGQSHSTTKSASDATTIHLIGDENNPFAGYMGYDKFMQLGKYGCSWCGGPIYWGEKGIVLFERDDLLICSDCSKEDKEVTRLIIPAKTFDLMLPGAASVD